MGFRDSGIMGRNSNWVKSADNPYLAQVYARMDHGFDRISKSSHADSAFEEARVKGRRGYFIIVILLILLNAAVTVYSAVATWNASPGDIWSCGLSGLLGALGATSLVSVWVQAVLGSGASSGGQNEECVRGGAPIPTEGRGH